MPPGRLAWLAVWLLFGSAACSSSGSTELIVHATQLEVAPSSFLGGVPCRAVPGGIRSYLALLLDVTPTSLGGPGTTAVTSPDAPVSCLQSTIFSQVVQRSALLDAGTAGTTLSADLLGHRYAAVIRGYDGAETSLADYRWSTRCGVPQPPLSDAGVADAGAADAGDDPLPGVVPQAYLTRRVEPCAPLYDRRPSDVTAISVALDSAVGGSLLGSLQCGDTPGTEVASFVARVVDPPQGTPSASDPTDCSGEAVLPVNPGAPLRIVVTASDAAGTELWRSDCYATPVKGVTLPANCDPLTPITPP